MKVMSAFLLFFSLAANAQAIRLDLLDWKKAPVLHAEARTLEITAINQPGYRKEQRQYLITRVQGPIVEYFQLFILCFAGSTGQTQVLLSQIGSLNFSDLGYSFDFHMGTGTLVVNGVSAALFRAVGLPSPGLLCSPEFQAQYKDFTIEALRANPKYINGTTVYARGNSFYIRLDRMPR